jgi:hypothetical protein
MKRKVMFLIFLSVLAGLNLGSIRRAEDPIRDTQTDPILYEQKKEEEKDGKKGPVLYHVKNSPRETFFIDPPFEKEKKSSTKELVTKEIPSSSDTAGWWEEQSTAPQAVSEPLPEPLPEAEGVQDSKIAEQSAVAREAENVSSGKGEDYWW